MRTEISVKFTRAGLEQSLRAAGFSRARFWTDRAKDFSLSLWQAGSGLPRSSSLIDSATNLH